MTKPDNDRPNTTSVIRPEPNLPINRPDQQPAPRPRAHVKMCAQARGWHWPLKDSKPTLARAIRSLDGSIVRRRASMPMNGSGPPRSALHSGQTVLFARLCHSQQVKEDYSPRYGCAPSVPRTPSMQSAHGLASPGGRVRRVALDRRDRRNGPCPVGQHQHATRTPAPVAPDPRHGDTGKDQPRWLIRKAHVKRRPMNAAARAGAARNRRLICPLPSERAAGL